MSRKKEGNMNFQPSFFETEEREGFLVSSTMKSVWAAKMDMLNEVIILCEKYGIQYYADWGTLLGAVRHGGFIPWDDDIDIAMLRKDYNRFIQVSNELPSPLFLRHYSTEQAVDAHACICNATTISNDEQRLKRFYGCPYMLGLDIFPLDYVSKNKEEVAMQEEVYKIVAGLIVLMKKEENTEEIELMLCNIEDICKIEIDRNRNILQQLYRLLDLICQMYGEKEAEELTLWSMILRDKKFRLKKEWYDKPIKMQFEQMQLYVPREYDKVLHEMYGAWRNPVKFSASHIYPCYKKQEEILNSYLERGMKK